jgi:hypothetical protein
MRYLIFIFSVLLSSQTFGQDNYLVYFGGGGEPDGETTIFDRSIPAIASFAEAQNYKAEYFSTKNHKFSAEMAAKATGNTTQEFTSENWSKKMNQLVQDIQSGKISKGSKLLLTIDTHGMDRGGIFRMSTVNGIVAPVEEIKRLIVAAEENGVSLGLYASNCTSGNLLKLASDKTCIVTSSMPNQYGFTSDGYMFLKNLRKAKNLEENFLESRNYNALLSLPAQPGISTVAGQKTQEALGMLLPYLSEREVDVPGSLLMCDVTVGMNALSKEMEALAKPSLEAGYDIIGKGHIRRLSNNVKDYNEASQNYQANLKQVENPIIKCFETPVPFIQAYGMGMGIGIGSGLYPSFGMTPPMSEDLLASLKNPRPPTKSCVVNTAQIDIQIKFHEHHLENARKNDDVPLEEKLLKSIASLKELAKDSALIESSKKIDKKRSDALNNFQTMVNNRQQIAQNERYAYDMLYKKFSDENKDKSNPCAKFSFKN